jgi:glycine/serine hydroxymethyltransferase
VQRGDGAFLDLGAALSGTAQAPTRHGQAGPGPTLSKATRDARRAYPARTAPNAQRCARLLTRTRQQCVGKRTGRHTLRTHRAHHARAVPTLA